MTSKASPVGLLALIGALAVLAFAASPAKAAFGIAEWEALTCSSNEDTPTLGGAPIVGPPPLAEPAGQCTGDPEDEAKWFRQATGHPPFGITDFTLNTTGGFPDGFVKDIVVDTPEGLGVNPEAYPACPRVQAETAILTCPLTTLVGINYLTVVASVEPFLHARAASPVFNVEPFEGVPSMVAFPNSAGEAVFIVGDLDPKDQHVRFTINDIHAPEPPVHPPIVGSRLVFFGVQNPPVNTGDGTYLTMPSNCAGGQTSTLHVKAHTGEEDTESFTTSVGANECETAPFSPNLETSAGGPTDSPGNATVDVQLPNQLADFQRGESHLLTAKVTLPQGSGLNPSVANGLVPCTDAQFKKGTDDPIDCPAASRIGSIEVDTKALDEPLGGDVYVGQPLSQNPSSGNQFRIFLHAYNDRYGVNVRLIGQVFPNLHTGQLTAVVGNNPQAPFNSFRVNLEGGPRGAVTSPPTCGPHTTTAAFTPWSRQSEEVPDSSQFTLATEPGGGPCAPTMASRPFDPGFGASTRSHKAGAYAPFDFHVARYNGNQELKRVKVKLPPGMTAKLAGVDYCPEPLIDVTGARDGQQELANPACPANSQVGRLVARAGTGPDPFRIGGSVYLAGPYKGAPVSFVFVTPAVAGPYDLGTVVIRAAAHLDPETAVVTVTSDRIPDVFRGVKLSIKSIGISMDRPRFTVNPTTCRGPFAVDAGISGGGADPNNPAVWPTVARNDSWRAVNCKALRFKPKFSARVLGGKKAMNRTANPRFQAIYNPRKRDANLRRAAFILPRATILDQSHIKTICTRVQLAANSCPKAAIYGHAKARSPLLDRNLKGPVYMLASDNQLPDLLVDLRGQVNVRLRGVISSKNGRLKTVFSETPDVAVDKFVLNMRGGNRGLLVNTRNLCQRKSFGFLNLKAQNSRRMKTKRLKLNTPACGKKGGKSSNG